ncbi:hypothetical protein PPL_02262 [Heterostelium album PN500]|uniref:E3 ubiquitin-protein ligase n=1 Tax=Heterostelium pallidum (strain ATCC 26659 / Pp 5 / PN500) TaxID=670386 RepID=D3B1T8_HETP5|nr:hypothetical protein PPL_02262 [Heterostelium album PN500]EFA85262.1 hypothetical protein PPL_02262 [Heterostelium album PN500]|eukprot:XP_020437371.1 hypothetical protein PPL_02262 [Heterostelium album PN500]
MEENQWFLFGLDDILPTLKRVGDLPVYGSEAFTSFSEYNTSLKKIEKTQDIDVILAKFLGVNEPPIPLFSKDKFKLPFCNADLQHNTLLYRCLDCSLNFTACVCEECFRKGNHLEEGHHFTTQLTIQGATCDCGNPDLWKPSGFCCDHHAPTTESTPSELLEPEMRKKLHLFVRCLLNFMLNEVEILNMTKSNDNAEKQRMQNLKNRVSLVLAWIHGAVQQSYPLLHIIAEELTLQTLDNKSFDINKPVPLSYTTKEEETDILPQLATVIPILTYIRGTFDHPDLYQLCIRLFKIYLFDVVLENYSELSLKVEKFIFLCGLFYDSAPIYTMFSTDYSKNNLFRVVIAEYKQLISKKEMFDLNNATDRETFQAICDPHTEMAFLIRFFREQPINQYIYNNDDIMHEYFKVIDLIQDIVPLKRALIKPKEYEPEPLQVANAISSCFQNGFRILLKRFHRQKLPTIKYLKSILSLFKAPRSTKYLTCNDYKLISNNIFNAVDTVSLYSPITQMAGVYLLSSLQQDDNYSLDVVRSLIDNDKLLYMINQSLKPMMLLCQYGKWTKNLNINLETSCYMLSSMFIDLFMIQYSSILLGPNYYLNFMINSFTSNYKSNEYTSCWSDMLKTIIQIQQLRMNPKHTPENVRHYATQSLIANKKMEKEKFVELLKSILYSEKLLEDAILEISSGANQLNTELKLKPERVKYFDFYFPLYLDEPPMKNYHELIKDNDNSHPLPGVLGPLHHNLEAINDLYNESLLYRIVFFTLLPLVHPQYKLEETFSDFEKFNKFSSFQEMLQSQEELDKSVNNCLYLLCLAQQHYSEKQFNTLSGEEKSTLSTSIKLQLSEKDNNNTIKSSFISHILTYHKVGTTKENDGENNNNNNTTQSMSILDLLIDLLVMTNKNRYVDKKKLINHLINGLKDIDESLVNYINNRKPSDDIIKGNEDEKLRSDQLEEVHKRQKEIKEMMAQQQKQFLQLNEIDESESSGLHDNNTPICVTCRSSTDTDTDPLGAMGNVCGFHAHINSKRNSLKSFCPSLKDNEFGSYEFHTFGSFYPEELKESQILIIMQFSPSFNISCCGHHIHKSCLINLSGKEFQGFHCPLCDRPTNLILPPDNINKLKSWGNDCFIDVLVKSDMTFAMNAPDVSEPLTMKLLWKYALSNIETLELTSRRQKSYNRGTSHENKPYFVYNDAEFSKRLNTLTIIYHNIINLREIPDDPTELWSDDNQLYDPFIVATLSFYLNRSSDPKAHIKKAYENLIFCVQATIMDSYRRGNPLSPDVNDRDKLVKFFSSVTDQFIRKAYLFHHCISSRLQTGNQSESQLTLEQFSDISYLRTALDIPTWQTTQNEMMTREVSITFTNGISFSIPPKPAKFIPLPHSYVVSNSYSID